MFNPIVQVKQLHLDAIIPKYATKGSAAIDLHAYITTSNGRHSLDPGDQFTFSTGISLWLQDPSICMMIIPRSSLGTNGLVLAHGSGLVDSDYQGEIKVPLLNRLNREPLVNQPINIQHGDRIAQAVLLPCLKAKFEFVEAFTEATARGEGGFGSTGK